MKLHRLLLILASAVVTVGCGDDGTGLEAVDLEGIWTASVYQFTDNANPQNVVDIIQRDGASFTAYRGYCRNCEHPPGRWSR